MIFVNNWAKTSTWILLSSLENRESAFFVFSEKAISEVKDMYCQGRQIYMPFCFALIQRGPSYYPKEKNYSHGTRIQETRKITKIGKQTLINPANTSRTATAKSNTTKIKRRRAPMLIPSRE